MSVVLAEYRRLRGQGKRHDHVLVYLGRLYRLDVETVGRIIRRAENNEATSGARRAA